MPPWKLATPSADGPLFRQQPCSLTDDGRHEGQRQADKPVSRAQRFCSEHCRQRREVDGDHLEQHHERHRAEREGIRDGLPHGQYMRLAASVAQVKRLSKGQGHETHRAHARRRRASARLKRYPEGRQRDGCDERGVPRD
jgi:hypothetical protein